MTSGVAQQGEGGLTTAPTEGVGEEGDEPGYTLTLEELCLREVYGDWVPANPGTHLDGGISDDASWQSWCHDLAVMALRCYDAQSGKVGRQFVGTLGGEF